MPNISSPPPPFPLSSLPSLPHPSPPPPPHPPHNVCSLTSHRKPSCLLCRLLVVLTCRSGDQGSVGLYAVLPTDKVLSLPPDSRGPGSENTPPSGSAEDSPRCTTRGETATSAHFSGRGNTSYLQGLSQIVPLLVLGLCGGCYGYQFVGLVDDGITL